MKLSFKIFLPFLLFSIIIGCNSSVQHEKNLEVKEYGRWDSLNDSLVVDIDLNKLQDFDELLMRTEEIECNDSIPRISFKTEKEEKKIYLRSPCWKNYISVLVKQRNAIAIHGDSVYKRHISNPLDSLNMIIKKDYYNRGTDPNYSDHPEKLLFYVSDDGLGLEKIPLILDKLTTSFENVTDERDLKIWFYRNIKNIPPPPPPPPTGGKN